MKPINLTLLIVLAVSLSACAFVPKVDHTQKYAKQCDMSSRALTLDTVALGQLDCAGNTSCLALVSLIPATSLIVSGSIVLVGNTLHWLEYQGRCDEGVVKSSLDWVMPTPDDVEPMIEEEDINVEDEAQKQHASE